jgi:HK97 family phage prohead protease
MPFGISQSQDDCNGWATVKQEADGSFVTVACHQTKQDAVDQMLAISFNEDIEPLGQVDKRDERSTVIYNYGTLNISQSEVEIEEEMPTEGESEIDEEVDNINATTELRQEPSLIAPAFMATSARRGLKLHEEGHSGDGLMPATVRDARRMANNEPLSEDKWRRIAPWIARHIVDLDAIEGDEITAGLVSMLLWGGGSTKTSARRAQEYAERLVARLDERSSDVDKVASMLDTMTQEARWCSIGNDERRVAYTTIDVREMQEGEGTTLYGYAAVFDSPSEPMPFVEYVKRGAFAKTLERGADVRLLIDHEGVPLARTKSGTLRLHEDERGLAVAADLDPNNPDAMRVMSALKRGDLSQMSFAFRTIKDRFSDDGMVRELDEVDLFDVSVVTFPAYERTVAEIRSRQLQPVESSDNLEQQSIGVNVRRAQLALARLIR